jgi:hypothetical protein
MTGRSSRNSYFIPRLMFLRFAAKKKRDNRGTLSRNHSVTTSSVRYGTRLGDLKENWFLLFSN